MATVTAVRTPVAPELSEVGISLENISDLLDKPFTFTVDQYQTTPKQGIQFVASYLFYGRITGIEIRQTHECGKELFLFVSLPLIQFREVINTKSPYMQTFNVVERMRKVKGISLTSFADQKSTWRLNLFPTTPSDRDGSKPDFDEATSIAGHIAIGLHPKTFV